LTAVESEAEQLLRAASSYAPTLEPGAEHDRQGDEGRDAQIVDDGGCQAWSEKLLEKNSFAPDCAQSLADLS
jgi:hypothetical protein